MSTNAKSIEVFPEQLPGQTITGKWARVKLTDGRVLTGLVGPSRDLGRAFIAIQQLQSDGTLAPEEHFHASRAVNTIRAVSFEEAQVWVDLPYGLISHVKVASAALMDVTVEELDSPSRLARIARVRHVAFLILREKGFTLRQIGKAFGERDHGTVLHGSRDMLGRITVEPDLARCVEFLRKKFKTTVSLTKEEREAA